MSGGNPKPRVAVGAVILIEDSVVLIRRGKAPSLGRWSLPGGRVEMGERLIDAASREVREETNLIVTVGPLVELVEILEAPHHWVVADYLCARVAGELRAGDDATDAALVPVDALAGHDVTEAVARVVATAVEMRRAR